MRVEPSGPVPCDLAIFGECPGYEEQQQGIGFVGKSGVQLWADMKRFAGLTRDDFYISNIVKEGQPKNKDPKPADVAAALPEFLDELEQVQPKIVVCAGGFSTRAMLGPVKMSDVHGIPHVAELAGHQYICCPCYHPAAGLHQKGFLSAFAYDLKQLKRLLDGVTRPWAPSALPARTSWFDGAAGRACEGFKRGGIVAVDTEGWTEHPWGLSFSLDGQNSWVISAEAGSVLDFFAGWIRNKTVVCHNGIHDVPVLRAMGVHLETFHDTQVLAYHDMLRTGSGVLEAESQNLGTLAYRECGLVLGELSDLRGVDLDNRVIPYTDEVRHYAGMDPIATWRLFDTYRRRGLVDTQAYQIDMGQVPLVESMIANGIPFDQTDALSFYAEILDKLSAVTTDLRGRAARLGNRDFNPGSHPQVRELITKKIGLRIRKRTKGGLASTNEKALADHQDVPFVQKLQEHRELVKLKGTYVEPLLEAIQ